MEENISDRIKKISNFFVEMQVTTVEGENIIYVIVNFPQKWMLDNKFNESVGVDVIQGKGPGQFLFATSFENGFNVIFDAIDNNITKMKDAEERMRLMSEKMNELQDLFEDESIPLENLKTLELTFRNRTRKPKKEEELKEENKEEDNNV